MAISPVCRPVTQPDFPVYGLGAFENGIILAAKRR